MGETRDPRVILARQEGQGSLDPLDLLVSWDPRAQEARLGQEESRE